MVTAVDVVAHEGVDCFVADAIGSRLDFAAPIGVEGVLSEALVGFESVTVKSSEGSTRSSSVTRTSKDFCVSPGAKRSVPRAVV